MNVTYSIRDRLSEAVTAAVTRAAQKEMEWGVDDCALWAAQPIQEVLGYDPAARFRGRYSTRIGAYRLGGGEGLLQLLIDVAQEHHWKQIQPIDGQPGDIGLALLPDETNKQMPSCMICSVPGWFVGRGICGFTALSPDYVARAWSVCP